MGKWRSGLIFHLGNPTRLLRSPSHHRFSRAPPPPSINSIFSFKSYFSSKKTTMGERSSGGRFPTRRGQAQTGGRWRWVPVGNSSIGQENGGSVLTGFGDRSKSPQSVTMPQQRRVSPERKAGDMESVPVGNSSIGQENGGSILTGFGDRSKSPQSVTMPQQRRVSPVRKAGDMESVSDFRPFNICRSGGVGRGMLKLSLLESNRERRKELERSTNVPRCQNLLSGMILLKKYLSHQDQVKIVQTCQNLGVGVGGFYRPSYRDGAKLHLQMMCLGKNWDPEEKYVELRPTDGAKPPEIPEEFRKLVKGAIQASHDFLLQQNKDINVEDELPKMSPDICIVNFYNENGRLGLHQDRDESPESLAKGLPVVSFSVGNSAEFLYGLGRDVDKADKILLESGDVLIFGGESRMIFHGVSTIQANTAPKRLIDETNLRPGRLNLTFRQH